MSRLITIPRPTPESYPLYLPSGCILYFDMQDAGNKLIDHSGMGNHGTNYGSLAVAGPHGLLRSFDGTDDYADFGTGVKPTVFTVKAWCKPSVITTINTRIIAGMTDVTNWQNGWAMYINDGSLYFGVGNGSWRTKSSVISPNVWYQGIGTLSAAGVFNFYINGAMVGTPTAGVGVSYAVTNGGRLAKGIGYNTPFAGLMGDVEVLSGYAMTASEARQAYREEAWKYGVAA